MGSEHDKAEGKRDRFKGKVKEGMGKATDDDSLEAQGRRDQSKGAAKESLGKAKDSVKDALRRE